MENRSDRYEVHLRLVRLARGLEAGGLYNAAKLLWGLAYAGDIEDSNRLGIPATRDDLSGEMERVIGEMRARGASKELLAALDFGLQAVRQNRTIPLEQIPETRVCRACGEFMLGAVSDGCPTCGSPSMTLKEFPPMYFLEPLLPGDVLAALAAAPAEIEAKIKDLGEEQLRTPPRSAEWCLRDALAHLVVAQGLLAVRVRKMLAEDDPSLAGVAAWTEQSQEGLLTVELLDRFASSRMDTVRVLRGMPAQDWWRTAHHEEFGTVSVLQQASYFAKHERHHFPQMDAIRKAIGA